MHMPFFPVGLLAGDGCCSLGCSLVPLWTSEVALMVRNLPANAGDTGDAGSIPGLQRSPGGGNGNPLQYSCLENPVDRGAWWVTVHGVARV